MRPRWWAYIVTDGLDSLFADQKHILTVQEVADLFRMNKAGVYKWLNDGVIPGYHRGRSWFIVRDELKEWMRLGSNQSRVPADPTDQDEETAEVAADKD